MQNNHDPPNPSTPKEGGKGEEGSWLWSLFSTTKKKKKSPESEGKSPTTPHISLPPIQLTMNGSGGTARPPSSNSHNAHRTGAPKDDGEEEEEVFHSPEPFPSVDALRNEASLYFFGGPTNSNNGAQQQTRVSFHPSTNGTPARSSTMMEEDRDLMTFTPAAQAATRPSSLRTNRYTTNDENTKKSPHKVGTRTAPRRRTFVPAARSSLAPPLRRNNTIQMSLLRMPPPPLSGTTRTADEERQRTNVLAKLIRDFHTNAEVAAMPQESPHFVRPVALNQRSWIAPPPPPSVRPSTAASTEPRSADKKRHGDKPLTEGEATVRSGTKRDRKVAFASPPAVETVDETKPSPDDESQPAVQSDRDHPFFLFDPVVEDVPGLAPLREEGVEMDFHYRSLPSVDLGMNDPPPPSLPSPVFTEADVAEDERLRAIIISKRKPVVIFSTDDQMEDEAPAADLPPAEEGWANLFSHIYKDQWKCEGCNQYNLNTYDKCPSCNKPRPGVEPSSSSAAPAAAANPGVGVAAPAPAVSFSFGVSNPSTAAAATNAGVSFGVASTPSTSFSFGVSNPSTAAAPAASTTNGSSTNAPSASAATNFVFGVVPSSTTAANNDTTSSTSTFGTNNSTATSMAPPFSFASGVSQDSNVPSSSGALVASGSTAATGDSTAPSTGAAILSFGGRTSMTTLPATNESDAPSSGGANGGTTDAQSGVPAFTFGGSQPTSAPPSDGAPAAANTTFSFLSATAKTSTAPAPTGGFSFATSSGDTTTASSTTAPASFSFLGTGNVGTTNGSSFGTAATTSSPALPTPAATIPSSQPFQFGSSGNSFQPSNGTTTSFSSEPSGSLVPTFGGSSSERIEDPRSTKKKRRDPETDNHTQSSTEMPPPLAFGGATTQPNAETTPGTSLFRFGQTPVTTTAAPSNAPPASTTTLTFGSSSNTTATTFTTSAPLFGASTPSIPTFGASNPSTTTTNSTFSLLPPASSDALTPPSLPPPAPSTFTFGGASSNPSMTSSATPSNPSSGFTFGASNTTTSSVPPPTTTTTPGTFGGFGSFPSTTPAAPPLFGQVGGNTNAFGMDTMEASSNNGFSAPAPFAPTSGFPTHAFGAPANPFATPNVGGFGQPQTTVPPSNFAFNTQPPAFGAPPPPQFGGASAPGGFASAPQQGSEGGFQMGSGGPAKRRILKARRPH